MLDSCVRYLLIGAMVASGVVITTCTSSLKPAGSIPLATQPELTDGPCNFPVYAVMPGINFYRNATENGDDEDPKLKGDNDELLRPLYQFVLSATRAIDGTAAWRNVPIIDQECVRQTLESWASAGALLTRPPLSGGLVNRVTYAVGLNVLALKARKAGISLSPAVANWLFALTQAVVADYGVDGYHHHGFHNNINAWSGAAAATFLAFAANRNSDIYQSLRDTETRIWLDSLRGINQFAPGQGLIPSELDRGANAFMYSLFYLSAVSMHLRAREVTRYMPSSYVRSQFKRAIDVFSSDLCGATDHIFDAANAELSAEAKQQKKQDLGPFAFRVLIGLQVFRAEDPRLHCLDFSIDTTEARFGGNVIETQKAFGIPSSLSVD